MNDIIGWHIAFYFLAAHFAMWDLKKGTFLRKSFVSFHNFTHSKEKSLTLESDVGFIHNNKLRDKLFYAVVFAVVLSVVFHFVPDSISTPTEVVLLFTKVPVVVVGFYSATFLSTIYTGAKKLVGIAEKVEEGEINVKKEIYDRTSQVASDIKSGASEIADKVSAHIPSKETPVETPKDESETKSTDTSDEDARFLKKIGKGS